MKRVYTDERFRGAEIVNNGSGTFEVWIDGNLSHTFESWENPDGTISEPFAAQRARDYFDRWAKGDLSGEFEDEQQAIDPEAMDKLDHSDQFNVPGENLSAEIDALMAAERAETDPQKKADLRQNLLRLMKREESLAESVVNHLLES